MPKPPQEHECDHILIVEGHSDLLFCAALLHHMQRLEGVFIKEFKGKSNILNRDILGDFLTPKRLAGKKSIGVIIDADDNPAGAVQAIKERLRSITGRELNESEWQEGEPRLGFFVAPAADQRGQIETLAWNAFPQDGVHGDMKNAVDGYLATMETWGWKPKNADKGRIAAYLAAAHDEDARLGPGARGREVPFRFARICTASHIS